jgi:conjugative transposon protein TcpC
VIARSPRPPEPPGLLAPPTARSEAASGNGHEPRVGGTPWRWTARSVRPARVARRRARAPGTLALVALLLLAAVGVKATLAPRHILQPAAAAPSTGSDDITVQGFAQAFARAFLSWDAADPDRHRRQLAGFLADTLDGDGGLRVPSRGSQQVLWTSAIGDQPDAHRDRLITVAAQTTRELLYLSVPVHRTARGFLVVPRYPALVGPPVSDPAAPAPEERQVADGALRAVTQRALTNYLAGQRSNLLADLDSSAVVSLPTTVLHVSSVRSVTKAARDRVAVELTAADEAGLQWTLRYELTVVRRDRWYVRAIATVPPAAKGRP